MRQGWTNAFGILGDIESKVLSDRFMSLAAGINMIARAAVCFENCDVRRCNLSHVTGSVLGLAFLLRPAHQTLENPRMPPHIFQLYAFASLPSLWRLTLSRSSRSQNDLFPMIRASLNGLLTTPLDIPSQQHSHDIVSHCHPQRRICHHNLVP